MITLKNIRTLSGHVAEHTFPSPQTQTIEGNDHLLMLPAWIDTDITLGKLNDNSVQKWEKIALELLLTGATTIIDNTGIPPDAAKRRKEQLAAFFKSSNIPLRLHSVFDGTTPGTFEEMGRNKEAVIAIKTSLELLYSSNIIGMHANPAEHLFQLAAQENMLIIVSLSQHTDRQAALAEVDRAIELAEKFNTEICLQHVRTKEELEHIQQAKAREMLVYTEVAYQNLLFTDEDLKQQDKADTRTFLPTQDDHIALWKGINNGSIDMIGSGDTLLDSGNPTNAGKYLLPLMLDACRHEKMSYETLVAITRINVERIFRLNPTKDVVLVDTEQVRPLPTDNSSQPSLLSLWSGRSIAGWPAYVIVDGQVYQA